MMCIGTRPEAIKMMPLIKALRKQPTLELLVAVTGQHREMLLQVFDAFQEAPDVNLDLMTQGQTLPAVTATILSKISDLIDEHSPNVVLVHGDTTTALACALAAYYARCKIGHVEAGLRSFDLARPWPEEFNRVAIDALADYLFAPTESARDNLLAEYNRRGEIVVTGNTGIDALLLVARQLDADPKRSAELAAQFHLNHDRRLILVTGHRRESFGEGFERICDGLARLAARPDVEILYPVHLNPQVRAVVMARLSGVANIRLIDPVGYVEMVFLMKRASIIVTDSGGIQEEGPALGRPVLVLRDVTERPEALATGVAKLVGTDPERLIEAASALLDDDEIYSVTARAVFPFGDGSAAERIASFLAQDTLR
jgi:UDP-N-acetylglucosamine 2-epimerase